MSTLETHINRFIERQSKNRIVVAYSGGVDSLVLLHAIHKQLSNSRTIALEAVHVNHNLHKDSASWAEHCEQNCRQFNIPISVYSIEVDRSSGESLEAKAREMRYACLERHADQNSCILTGHHQDDQAETLLLQLMRGSGPKGLASMPEVKPLRLGILARPLLSVSRSDILAYAKSQSLDWIDDSSNCDTDFDRNFIRHKILPQLGERWPSASMAIARSARQCASMSKALQSFTQDVLAEYHGSEPNSLSRSRLRQRPRHDIQALIRCWLQQGQIVMPSAKQLQQIVDNVVMSNEEAAPCVTWSDYEIRRYRDEISVANSLPAFAPIQQDMAPNDICIIPGLGEYYFEQSRGRGFCWPEQGAKNLQIRFRKGGEICQPLKRAHKHKLKKLLQEMAVPSWQRGRLPLLFDGSQMIAVADLLICEPYGVRDGELGYRMIKRTVKV